MVEGKDLLQGEELSDNPLTFPNLLSLLRLLATPLIIVLLLGDNLQLAFYLFVIAAITDFVDGWYAKVFKAQTRFGAFLDPIADKVLTISVYFWLGLEGLAPEWFVVLIISRDLFILVGILITWIAFDRLWVAPLGVGKITTFAQLSLVGLILIKNVFPQAMNLPIDMIILLGIYIVSFFSLLSIFTYATQWFVRIVMDKQ